MKICCLLPSAAEILYALNLADHIIGVSDLCQYPPEILKTKPIVSRSKIDPNTLTSQQVEAALTDLLQRGESPYQLDQQWLTDAAPDLIFTQDLCHICEIDANEVTQTLQQTPIQPQIIVLQPRTYQDILDSITQIGQICAVPHRAHDLVASLTQRANRITQTIAAANPRRPKVLSLERHQPPRRRRPLDPRPPTNGRRPPNLPETRRQRPTPNLASKSKPPPPKNYTSTYAPPTSPATSAKSPGWPPNPTGPKSPP